MQKDCVHKVYYCKITGGNRCRTCKKLLDDFGNEYQQTKTIEEPKQKIITATFKK